MDKNEFLFYAALIFAAVIILIISVKCIDRKIKNERKRKSIKAKTDEAGRLGEQMLADKAESLRGYKRVLTNLYIPTKNGTTEIDVVLISKKGIFVFECKNMSGDIYGDDGPAWYHCSYNNSFSFYNPVYQNRVHINALKNILKMDNSDYFRSVVVLSNHCGMRGLKLRQDSYRVIRLKHLNKTYKKYRKKVLAKEDVDYIFKQLRQYTKASRRVKRNHIKYVSSK